jgi:Protein of unknown function (DUF1761)
MSSRINHLAVFVSAIAFFILGWVWYDLLFGRTWMALTGHVQTSAGNMTPLFVGSFILGWALAYVIAIALADSSSPNPARHGVEFGIFMGLGIYGTMLGIDYLYEGRTIALWAINTGYVVVGMCVMGAIIGAWRAKAAVAVT